MTQLIRNYVDARRSEDTILETLHTKTQGWAQLMAGIVTKVSGELANNYWDDKEVNGI